jgi:hypothetical protein
MPKPIEINGFRHGRRVNRLWISITGIDTGTANTAAAASFAQRSDPVIHKRLSCLPKPFELYGGDLSLPVYPYGTSPIY